MELYWITNIRTICIQNFRKYLEDFDLSVFQTRFYENTLQKFKIIVFSIKIWYKTSKIKFN